MHNSLEIACIFAGATVSTYHFIHVDVCSSTDTLISLVVVCFTLIETCHPNKDVSQTLLPFLTSKKNGNLPR